MEKPEIQTTFFYGKPHYSETHLNHKIGPKDTWQQDLFLKTPTTNIPLAGSSLIEPYQSKLVDFKEFKIKS